MLATITHVKSVTVADGTNTTIVRPSDWNSTHLATIQFTNTDLVQWFSAGTSSISSGTLAFGNANGVSFGMNNGTLTASFSLAVPAISAVGASQNSGTIVFSNSNGVSFGMNGSTVTASFSDASNISIAAGGSTVASGTVSFGNSNGVSFGFTHSTLTASVVLPAISAAGTSQNSGTIVFSNSNGVTFGMNGSTVTASFSDASNISIAAGGSTVASGTVSFGNSNGVSFGFVNSTLTASVVLPAISAAGASQNSGTLVFSNSNNVTFGMNGSTVTASATVSYPAATTMAISAAGASQNNGTVVFSSSTNCNISFGMAGSTVTATYNDSDTRRNLVFSGFDLVMGQTTTGYNTAATSTSRPWIAMPLTLLTSQGLTGFLMTAGFSATSSGAAATNSGTLSMGIYSSSAGTLSQVWTSSVAFVEHVSSSSISVSFGGGASSLSTSTVSASTSALYRISIPLALTLQSGTYYFGVMDQMAAAGVSLIHGVWSNPLPLTSGLIIASSVTSAISDPTGVISAAVTTAAGAAPFPLSLTVNSGGPNTASKYPMAMVC